MEFSASLTLDAKATTGILVEPKSLDRPEFYQEKIVEIVTNYYQGKPLSDRAKTAMEDDLKHYKNQTDLLENWYKAAQTLQKPSSYSASIQRIHQEFKSGIPLTEQQIEHRGRDIQAVKQYQRSRQQNQLSL